MSAGGESRVQLQCEREARQPTSSTSGLASLDCAGETSSSQCQRDGMTPTSEAGRDRTRGEEEWGRAANRLWYSGLETSYARFLDPNGTRRCKAKSVFTTATLLLHSVERFYIHRMDS